MSYYEDTITIDYYQFTITIIITTTAIHTAGRGQC